jgi:hypothetical protein
MMAKPKWWKDFINWKKDFCKSKKGKEALNKLKDLDVYDDGVRFKKFESLVLENCYLAQSYCGDKDWAVKTRDRHKLVDKAVIDSQISAIRKMRKFIKSHPDISSGAMAYSILGLNKKNISVSTINNSVMSCDKLIDDILLEYSNGLSKSFPSFMSEGMAHRFSYGALIYPKPLDKQNQKPPDIALNSLLFVLTDIFKQYVFRKGMITSLDCGRKLCEGRTANYKNIALIINATFNLRRTITDKQIRGKVCDMNKSGITLDKWPHQ